MLPLRDPRGLHYSLTTGSKKSWILPSLKRKYRASLGIGKIVGTGILKFKIYLCCLSVCYIVFVSWKIVARQRFSRVGLSLVYERLTSPAKGFAPFLAPLGARGDLQDFEQVFDVWMHYRRLLSLCSYF